MQHFDITKPRWNQGTFVGRLKHFFNVTDVRTVFVTESKLFAAKDLVEQYRKGSAPPGVKLEELYYAQKLYMSAFHPDTGELQNVFGRMSCQVPCGMALIGAMMTWYRSAPAVIFWQWLNQSFNALVNYTNRNAKSSISSNQMFVAYCSATGSALVAAIGLKSLLSQRAGSLAQRFVPFVAVAAANCVNIPLTRQSELLHGIQLVSENDAPMCHSQVAAFKAISLVVISRIAIVVPSMICLPFLMERVEKMHWFATRRKFLNAPFQTFLTGLTLLVMVPIGCALFPQRNSITAQTLKRYDRDAFNQVPPPNRYDTLYFNKGL